MVEKFVSHTFYLMQIVRVSLFFIQKPPVLSHFRNAAAWPYEMKYIKSYCYFGIYNSATFRFGSSIFVLLQKILFFTNGIPME